MIPTPPSHQLTTGRAPVRGLLNPPALPTLIHDLFLSLKEVRGLRPSQRLPRLEHAVLVAKAINSLGYKVFLEGKGRITGARASSADPKVLTNIPFDAPTLSQSGPTKAERMSTLSHQLRALGENKARLLLLRRLAEIKAAEDKGGVNPTGT